jgi:energy-coupling factor transport system substrate-specific component
MNNNRWRTVDVVVAAVLGVAFGVIFWAWGLLWDGPASAIPLPGRALIYGIWLVPAVLGPLVIRKPGAGIFTEFVAATVSTFFGSPWGLVTLLYGLFQGAAGEFAFAATGYRSWRLPTAIVGGALAALLVLSSAIVAGVGGWLLTRALAQTGVLDRFPAGRDRALV